MRQPLSYCISCSSKRVNKDTLYC